MEHFALQDCCRLGQIVFSMEINNLCEIITMKMKMQDAVIIVNFNFPTYSLEI